MVAGAPKKKLISGAQKVAAVSQCLNCVVNWDLCAVDSQKVAAVSRCFNCVVNWDLCGFTQSFYIQF